MAHEAGDLVEIVTEVDEKGKVTETAPAMIVGNADDEGGAYGIMKLQADSYASEGEHLGAIHKPKREKKEENKK